MILVSGGRETKARVIDARLAVGLDGGKDQIVCAALLVKQDRLFDQERLRLHDEQALASILALATLGTSLSTRSPSSPPSG